MFSLPWKEPGFNGELGNRSGFAKGVSFPRRRESMAGTSENVLRLNFKLMGNPTMDPRGSTELTVEVLRGDDNNVFLQNPERL